MFVCEGEGEGEGGRGVASFSDQSKNEVRHKKADIFSTVLQPTLIQAWEDETQNVFSAVG